MSVLLDRLRNPDAVVRARACREIASDESGSLFAEHLIQALADRSRAVRRAAGDALVQLAGGDPTVADLVLRELRADPASRRWPPLEAAQRLSPPEPGWLPAIIEAMASAPNDVRWAAARLLVDLAHRHPETRGVAAGLVLDDERPEVRRMAVFCLGSIDADSQATASLLERTARDADAEVRRAAQLALAGRGGLVAKSAAQSPVQDSDQKISASSE